MPKYDLLKRAYAIIEDIPDENFRLSDVVKESNDNLKCGIIACAIGWFGLLPDMQAEGLRTDNTAGNTYWKGERIVWRKAGANLFDISESDAAVLFGAVRGYESDTSDKEVFLKRLSDYLRAEGQLDG